MGVNTKIGGAWTRNDNAFESKVQGYLKASNLFQLVLVQVGPPPDPGVDDVREALPAGHLKTPVQSSLDRHASAKQNG